MESINHLIALNSRVSDALASLQAGEITPQEVGERIDDLAQAFSVYASQQQPLSHPTTPDELAEEAAEGAEFDPMPEPSPRAVPPAAPVVESDAGAAAYAAAARPDIRRRLTINDKFRYRRELFAGSDSAMADALAAVAALPSAGDADHFITEELGFNTDSEAEKDFRDMVADYYKSLNRQ